MKTVTFSMPLGNRSTGEEFARKEATGFAVGPFAVHESQHYASRAWSVTHVATGCLAQEMLPSKKRALWLAKRLCEFDVWGFTDPKAASEIAPEILDQIRVLRTDAMYGDLQGSLS